MDLSESTGDSSPGDPSSSAKVLPVVKWLAVAEFVFGVGALVVLGETNPMYYVLVVAVGAVIVALVAYDQRRREKTEQQTATRRAIVGQAADDALANALELATAAPNLAGPNIAGRADDELAAPEGSGDPATTERPARPAPRRSTSDHFVAALVEYSMHTGVRTITRADREGWTEALRVEYALLRAAACCAENEREVVGELVMWDSVSVLHLLDTPEGLGDGISRSVVAPYGRLPAATRVPVRRDPARLTCEVATLALDPLVADEYALNLLWRGIYDHARRGGATEVVWTLASDLAALWRDRFGFPLEILGDNRRAASATTVTVVIPLPELEIKLLRERPAYYGWLTVGFAEAERTVLGLPIDRSGAYDRVCAFVIAKLDDLRSPLALR
ncbi:unannotated protein [freshwater metagenome]|uniref:Unannotated protein n=1 Tax=freshwater metagenome TaxID=449393 RepID=A0A6J6TZZ0_9ZZZZ